MKPFNLESARAGKPVVTRNGQPVPELHCFCSALPYPLYAVIGSSGSVALNYSRDGTYGPSPEFDLFMAEE